MHFYQSLVDTISNILDESNLPGWDSLQGADPSNGSELLLENAEELGKYLANTLSGNNTQVVISRNNIGRLTIMTMHAVYQNFY